MGMDLRERVASGLPELMTPDGAALLMVSGGSDSTALAYLMSEMREAGAVSKLAMLHVNHKLRGDDAEADALFCKRLADELGLPFFLCEVDVAAEARLSGQNIEAQARHERYAAAREALSSLCEHEGASLEEARIAVAHTADDRMENFFMRSIVGTGPGGFRGIRRQRENIVRPLLDCTRAELRDYLRELPEDRAVLDDDGNRWREDATNADTDRFRAYVRANIVPRALEWNSALPQVLGRTMDQIADEDDMLDEMACEAISEHAELGLAAGSFRLLPGFGQVKRPLAKRAIHRLLKGILGEEERIAASTVEGVMDAFENGFPKSGYVTNLQGNLAVSANSKGVLVEPMSEFRRRRKRDGREGAEWN